MYKKSLLSSMATAAVVLFNIQFNVHAKSLEVSGAEQEITGETGKAYEIIHAKEGGKITGENLTITGNKNTSEGSAISPPGSSSLEAPAAVTAEGKNSVIKLTGDKTTIKGTDFDIILGLEAKDNGIINITGGTVNVKEVALFAGYGGHITVKNVVLSAKNDEGFGVVVAGGDKSIIELQENTKIENAVVGLAANNNSTIKMTGGSITASGGGASFFNSKSDANELNGVTISSNNEGPLLCGINADKSIVTLKNVILTNAEKGIFANNSKLEVFGGKFNGKYQSVHALNGGSIILKDGATITSTDGTGLLAESKNSTIKITGGNVTGNQAASLAKNKGYIEVKDATLKATGDKGTGAGASDSDSVIKLSGNTTVESTFVGLGAANGGKVEMTGGTVTGNQAALSAIQGGHIEVTDVSLKTNIEGFGAQSIGPNSMIELHGNTTIDDAIIGLFAQDGGAIKMNGGSITVSTTDVSTVGASFSNNSKGNELENVTISKKESDTSSLLGISAINNSQVTLTNVTVSQATNAIVADHEATITVSGGEFDAKNATVKSYNNSIVTLTNDVQITSSEFLGIWANDNGAISMTGGTIKASQIGATFENSKREENRLENVTISSVKDDAQLTVGIAANKSTVALKNVKVSQATNAIVADHESTITVSGGSFDTKDATVASHNNSIVTLTNNTQITSSKAPGLWANNNGAISMTGGTIKASQIGATFENSKRKENSLDGVTISSVKDDVRLTVGVAADKSTVTLTNVTVKQAEIAIGANDQSTITVSGGSFDAKGATVISDNNSIVTLTNNAQITSSEAPGLWANNNGAISMTGGTIKASIIGATFEKSKREENRLENVTISSVKDDEQLNVGVSADNSTVALTNVTVKQAKNAIVADHESTITVSGGSFESESDAVYAKQGSSITLNNATVTSSQGDGVYVDDSDSKIVMIGGSIATKNEYSSALLAEKEGVINTTDVTLTTDGIGTGVVAFGKSIIELHGNTTINNTFNGLRAVDGGKITSENLTITGGKPINSGEDTERSGLTTENAESEINLTGKTIIQNVDEGLYADGGSKITSEDLTIIGGESEKITSAVGSWEPESKIELNGNTIIKNFDIALGTSGGASIKMKNGTKNAIDAKKVALSTTGMGKIDLANTFAKAGNIGLQLMALSKINTDELNDLQTYENNEINLTNTNIHVDDGTGILVGAIAEKNIENSPVLSIGTVNLKDSEIHADVLLGSGVFWDTISWKEKNIWNDDTIKEISTGSFTLNADHSTLEGRANIAKERNVHFDLKNGTQWILKNSAQEKDADGNLLDIAQRSRSDISVLGLNDSSIVFQEPTENHYHTLHIGSGKPDTKAVYNATGDARIYFNTKWSDGGSVMDDQKTDRLIIHGDVSGSTTVYIKSDLGDKDSVINASDPSNSGGISLIQVSGKADENSFKLAHGYTTKGGSPYKYTLTGYGLESSHGKADIEQSLFDEKDENFWDFRLHKEFLGPNSTVEAPVAQMASYLVMPNALFYSGLTDMAKQNALLANMRTSVAEKGQGQSNGFFLHTYGSTGTLSSARGPLEYGYGARLRYAALQGGVNFAALEGHNTTTHLGLLGTYGQLSFTPKDMKDAGKSTMDKWSLTAYGTIQHDNGFYLDALLSYGFLKGKITNALIGTTAKLKNAKMLSISTTVGKQFATGIQGVTFEPQAQLAYQHLMFDTIKDADNLTIDMQNPSQWLIRVGGRLTKTVASENSRPMSFYGKVNLIKTFGDDQALHIDKDYKRDPMGSFLEGGVGINAQLSAKLSLHGDVSYQQKLQKTGISGANFSGGVRYQF
ncbi:autotransporter outer membrane beta-barrel domain-containing protein [Bartonella tribocorum]|nr:autotransporter outer membrane beta-barrel domain-containing protein [Bartonella tribocorum]